MASLRKRFSKWALGGDEPSARPGSGDTKRASLDSGYQSINHQIRWSHEPLLLPQAREESPKSSPKILHKALSSTFGYLANTARHGASLIRQESFHKENFDQSERANVEDLKETPSKHSHRSSLLSSIRSRRGRRSPVTREVAPDATEYPELPPTPTRIAEQKAPTIQVNLPGPSLCDESPQRMSDNHAALVAKKLWPSPTTVATNSHDRYIERDNLSPQARYLVTSDLAYPSPRKGPSTEFDENGYDAEIESSAQQSENEAPSPAYVEHITPDLPVPAATFGRAPAPNVSRLRLNDQLGSPTSVATPSRVSSSMSLKFLKTESSQQGSRLPSDMYEADVELSPEAPPNMGSRTTWEHNRADRDRRYLAAVKDENALDSCSPDQLRLPESPDSSLVRRRPYAFLPSLASSDELSGYNIAKETPVGPVPDALGYAVEAIERLSGSDIPEEDESLRAHFSGQSPTSMLSMCLSVDDIMAFGQPTTSHNQPFSSDSDTDVSNGSPSQQFAISTPEDAYDAGMRAAGLSVRSYSTQSSITMLGNSRANGSDVAENPGHYSSNEYGQTSITTPMRHLRSASNFSTVTDESCAITTSSPSCDASPPFPVLHVRSMPVGRISSAMEAVNMVQKEDIPLAGPANTGLNSSSLEVTGEALPSGTGRTETNFNAHPRVEMIKNPVQLNRALDLAPSDRVGQLPPSDAGLLDKRLNVSSSEEAKENLVKQTVDMKTTTPKKAFVAARLPKFNTPSPNGISPQSKRSLRRQKKALGRLPFSEASGNTTKVTPMKEVDPPQFRVKHFESNDGYTAPYAGHELDAVVFKVNDENAGSLTVESGKDITTAVADVDTDDIRRTDKPRWRAPSKVTESSMR